MTRYIDADALIKQMIESKYICTDTPFQRGVNASIDYWATEIKHFPAADVVPRIEVDKLEYTLLGVMHSVDKWLEGDELKQDEVKRAITMREKTLRIIENTKSEVAREIFEEIENLMLYCACDYGHLHREIQELKKKYTEGEK